MFVSTFVIWCARFFCFVSIVVFYGHFEIRNPWLDFWFMDSVDGTVETVTRETQDHWHTERDRYKTSVTFTYAAHGIPLTGTVRSYDLKDGFDRLTEGETIDVYYDDPRYPRLRPPWKLTDLLGLGYLFMAIVPALFLGVTFAPLRRALAWISRGDGVPWRWGIRAFGLFFVLTALSVRAEQMRALLLMPRADAAVTGAERQVIRNNLAFAVVEYSYAYDGIDYSGAFRTDDGRGDITAAHAEGTPLRVWVDPDDPRISVAHIDWGAAWLALLLLMLGGAIIFFSYPVGWRVIGKGVQWKLERDIEREKEQAS